MAQPTVITTGWTPGVDEAIHGEHPIVALRRIWMEICAPAPPEPDRKPDR